MRFRGVLCCVLVLGFPIMYCITSPNDFGLASLRFRDRCVGGLLGLSDAALRCFSLLRSSPPWFVLIVLVTLSLLEFRV